MHDKLPHEHDESADGKVAVPRKVIKQASADLNRGLKDTDRGAQMANVYKKLKRPQNDLRVHDNAKLGRLK